MPRIFFVENELFDDVPGREKSWKTNQRYYSSRKDIRNHIALAISAQKYSNDDQESLRHKTKDWRQRNSFRSTITGREEIYFIQMTPPKGLKRVSSFSSARKVDHEDCSGDTAVNWF